ncbi:AraC family transcriptional regulator [Marinobacter sp. NP-6]|uniref:helix-turn-helix domain-containing protein n=1 Tax=Marinobacter sp. NP-6 TaxID=2488666 RepID=UPI000FCA50BA|nr:AraC family transcriptional regulator [Marinobacter sp. NP-6]RUT76911.1 AraC family transcriptional regulator [Marinobacter sp. NP-6]
MNLVRSGALSGFKSLVSKYGANPVQLILDSGLSDAQFRSPDTYISYPKMALLLEEAALACRAPLFGLILAEQNSPGVLGDLPATVSREPTVGQALAELSRHIYLVARGVHITQIATGDTVRLQLRFDFKSPMGSQQLLQLSVAHLANIAAQLMGVDRFSLVLHLQQDFPDSPRSQSCRFSRRTAFSSDFDGVLVSAASLKRKPVFDEAIIQRHLHERLRSLQEKYPDSLPSQVRACIAQLLSSGECSIQTVASNIDMHPRMLQLKLKSQGTSYQSLLKETRSAIAEESLMRGSMAITDLALNLGFADIAVFSRSFKSWTGYSPRSWRKKFGEENGR